MQNVRPCPYCGGEVEVVRIQDKITYIEKMVNGEKVKEKKADKQYRIECKKCKKLVAKGTKFECETDAEGAQRIKDYEAEMDRIWYPNTRQHILKAEDKASQIIRAKASMFGKDDECNEIHSPRRRACSA